MSELFPDSLRSRLFFADRYTSIAAAMSSTAMPNDLKIVVSSVRRNLTRKHLAELSVNFQHQKESRRLILAVRLGYCARFSSHAH